jgi:hypothetical protein
MNNFSTKLKMKKDDLIIIQTYVTFILMIISIILLFLFYCNFYFLFQGII